MPKNSPGKILIFAGTFEGHELARYAMEQGLEEFVSFCVATCYGKEILNDVPSANVKAGRLTQEEMEALIKSEGYSVIVDATHPYADIATKNIKAASENCGVEYIRLLRGEGEEPREDGEGPREEGSGLRDEKNVLIVGDLEEAVEALNESEEGFLLTTGAKELKTFCRVKGYKERAVARVLPTEESLELALSSGLEPKRIICMQGPFTKEMNIATMEQYGLSILVTKSTGRVGGFYEKISLGEMGYMIMVIGRPLDEEGMTLDQVKEKIDYELKGNCGGSGSRIR